MSWSNDLKKIRRLLRDPDGNIWSDTFLLNLFNDVQRDFQHKCMVLEDFAVQRVPGLYHFSYMHGWEYEHLPSKYSMFYHCLTQHDDTVICHRWEAQHNAGIAADVSDYGVHWTQPWEAFMGQTPGEVVVMEFPKNLRSLRYIAYDEEPLFALSRKAVTRTDASYVTTSGEPIGYYEIDDTDSGYVLYPRPSVSFVDEADGNDGPAWYIENDSSATNTAIQSSTLNYLDGGDIAAFDFGASQDFTVEFWMKGSGGAATDKVIVGKRNTTGIGPGWCFVYDESTEVGSPRISDGTNESAPDLTTGLIANDGTYHHVAMVVDRGNNQMRVYVNSAEDTAAGSPWDISAVTGALDALTLPFRVFSNSGSVSVYDGGTVDDLRVWNDVRTSDEISNNYQRELTGGEANLIGYWKMNGTVGDSVTTVEDNSSNNNALTDTGPGTCTYVDASSIFPEIGRSGTIGVRIGSTDTDLMGVPYDITDTVSNVFMVYDVQPTELTLAHDDGDYPEFLKKYIRYGVVSRAYGANTDGRIGSLAEYWQMRYLMGIRNVKKYRGNIRQDRDYRLTIKGSHVGRKRRHPRLPSAYPAVNP